MQKMKSCPLWGLKALSVLQPTWSHKSRVYPPTRVGVGKKFTQNPNPLGNVLYQLVPLCLSRVKPQAVHQWCSKPTASFTTSDPNYCHTQGWLDLWRLDVSLTAQETHFSDLISKHECMRMYAKISKISSKHLSYSYLLPAKLLAFCIWQTAQNITEPPWHWYQTPGSRSWILENRRK